MWQDERGNALILVAAALPLMLGAAAMAVDTLGMVLAKRQLQRTADSAALAGAHAIVQEKAPHGSIDHDLELNRKLIIASLLVENAPTTGPFAGNRQAVRVTLSNMRPTPFFSFFSKRTPEIKAQATGAVIFAGQFCMISLEDGSTAGVNFQGNTTLDLGCGVATNSKAAVSITASGSSTIIASPVAAVGGVPTSSNYAGGTKLLPYSPKQADPFAKLPVPSPPADCAPQLSIAPNSATSIPVSANNVYCFKGMDIKGTVTLPPGTYYVEGGTFSAGSQAQISGQNVTIILTNSANPSASAGLEINGGAQLNLSAPESGPYGGVLFYQDPRAALGNAVRVNGNSLSSFEGAFYFPRATLNYSGTAGMRTECVQVVARRLQFSGNSRIVNQCKEGSASQAFNATFVRLVG